MMDLNCDAGEGFGIYDLGVDNEIFKYVTSVNIACGFHAGDPMVMSKTVDLAIQNDLCIGAHPSFPDLMGFGRREMVLSKVEIENYVLYQLGSLYAFVKARGGRITHVKPHGAMYNMAARNDDVAFGIVKAVHQFDPSLLIVGLPNSKLLDLAQEYGMKVAYEGFSDRNYNDDGTLVSRSFKNAVIEDINEITTRALSMANGKIISVNGTQMNLRIDTICIHSDTKNAIEIAKNIRRELEKHGIEVKGFGN